MASYHQKGSSYVVRWREGTRNLSARVESAKAAKAFIRDLDTRLAAFEPAKHRFGMTLREVAERWLNDREAEGRARHSYKADMLAILERVCEGRKWVYPADVGIDGLAALRISQWRCLKAALRHARRLGQTVDPQVLVYRRPTPKRKPPRDLLTTDQVAVLLAKAHEVWPPAAAVAHMVATYGHRAESVVGMEVGHVDLAGGRLDLRVKSGDRIRHPLLPATVSLLAHFVAEAKANGRRHLFVAAKGGGRPHPGGKTASIKPGGPWPDGETFSWWWYSAIGLEALPSHPGIYELKRYAISRMHGKIDLATMASITGHRTPSVLLKYARTNEERQQTAMTAIASLEHPVFPVCSLDKS